MGRGRKYKQAAPNKMKNKRKRNKYKQNIGTCSCCAINIDYKHRKCMFHLLIMLFCYVNKLLFF